MKKIISFASLVLLVFFVQSCRSIDTMELDDNAVEQKTEAMKKITLKSDSIITVSSADAEKDLSKDPPIKDKQDW